MATFGGLYLEVDDWAVAQACRRLYEDVLHLSVESVDEGESIWFDGGGMIFGFHVDQGGPPKEQRSSINLVIDVDEGVTVDDEVDRLRAAGVNIVMEPTDMPWGTRVITFADPAGHAVWYSQPIGTG